MFWSSSDGSDGLSEESPLSRSEASWADEGLDGGIMVQGETAVKEQPSRMEPKLSRMDMRLPSPKRYSSSGAGLSFKTIVFAKSIIRTSRD